MKKYIINILICLGILSSCSDFLDRQPYGQVSENNFYLNVQQATYAVNACYSPMRKLNGFWATGVLMFGNMCCDDCTQTNSINSAYTRGAFNSSDYYMVEGTFNNAYKGISCCNIGIDRVSKMTEEQINLEDKNRLIGEMKFIRGFWYYHLVRLFGSVPAVVKPVSLDDKDALLPPRTDALDVINNIIIPDFKFAAENLPETYKEDDLARATSGAAYSFLCAVNMLKRDYVKAIEAGEEVVKLANKGVYSLLSNMENIYKEKYEYNKENIFEVTFSKDQINWASHYFGTPYGGFCRGEVYSTHINPSEDLRDSFSLIDGNSISEDENSLYSKQEFWKNRDPRFDISFYTPLDKTTHKTTGELITFTPEMVLNKEVGVDFQKFTVWYGPEKSNIGTNNILMRYPEVLLNLAEAYIQTNDLEKAAKYINIVRKRARDYAITNSEKYIPKDLPIDKVLPDVSFNTIEDGMKYLRYERRVEFAGENIRGYDLRRWGIEKSTWAKVQKFNWEKKMSLLPIPASELNINPNIDQNPGY